MAITRRQSGFTLIEALTSSVVLCGAVVMISAISSKTLWQIRAEMNNRLAWQILDEQMTAVNQMGVSAFLAMGKNSGLVSYQDDNGNPLEYQWAARLTPQSELSGLYRLDLQLSWLWNKKQRQISATTLYYSSDLAGLTPSDTTEPQDQPAGEGGLDMTGSPPPVPSEASPPTN